MKKKISHCIEKNKCSQFKLENFLFNTSDVFHIARTTISSKNDLAVHFHDYAEVFWIKEGEGIHLVNDSELPLQSGNLTMIRPSDKHSFKIISAKSKLVITNIAFFQNSLDYFKLRYFPESTSFFWSTDLLPYSIQMTNDQLNELSSLTDRLMGQVKDNLHLDQIMLHIFSIITKNELISNQLPHWLSYAIENYTIPHYFSKGLNGFIELCSRNPDYINRTLRKHLNQSLSETVNKARLDYAAKQLIMTNSPVKTICFDCGYDNITYFYRLFKKFFGLTPVEYRSKNHKIF